MSANEIIIDRVVSDLKHIVRVSEDLLNTTMDAAGGKAEAIRERLADAATSARRTCQRLEDGAMDTAKAADRAVREHPYPSIGVAFGIGLLIGVLVTRK